MIRITDGYFHTTYDDPTQREMTEQYWRLMDRCKFILCPRGSGLNSARFFEALALGRLPILVGDDTALPLEERIPYRRFVVRVPEPDIEHWRGYLHAFLERNSNLADCSALAQQAYRCWFRVDSIRQFVETSLEMQ